MCSPQLVRRCRRWLAETSLYGPGCAKNQGVVHGGAVASLIDTASAFAVATGLEPGERVTTTDLTIHYLRPITEGEMRASARIVRAGRRLFVVSVDVCSDNQVPLATAVTGYIKLK